MPNEGTLDELEAQRLRAFNALAAQVDALQELVKILSERVDLMSERLGNLARRQQPPEKERE